jgi:ribonuclease P protein component
MKLDKRKMIRRAEEFNKIFQEGDRYSSTFLMLVSTRSDDVKFGFTVSKRIKGAVTRNRAKRKIREIVRLNQNRLPDNQSFVLMAKQGADRRRFQSLNEEFLSLLQQIK